MLGNYYGISKLLLLSDKHFVERAVDYFFFVDYC